MPHAPRDTALRRVQEQVIMIAHQAMAVRLDSESLVDGGQSCQKRLPIFIRIEDSGTAGTPVHDVVPGAGVFDA